MRVVHIISGLNVGGAELMLFRLLRGSDLIGGDFEHHVISLTSVGEIGEKLIKIGVPIHALNLNSQLDCIPKIVKLFILMRRMMPQIVQTWMYHADLIGGIVARLTGVPHVIWNVRNTLIPQGRLSRSNLIVNLCAVLSRWIPDKIVCCAEAGLANHSQLGYCVSKMLVIPNGFEWRLFEESRPKRGAVRYRFGIGENEIVIGIVGRFDALKDYQNFVHAADQISKLRPQARFLMLGRGVDLNNKLLASWLEKTSCHEKFILMGQSSEVAIAMAAMDIYCLASKAEGFPNVVAEAMLMQLPCVVTNVGDAALILQEFGRVVPPKDSVALCEALVSMIDVPKERRQAIGRAAMESIKQRYSIELIVEKYNRLYSSYK